MRKGIVLVPLIACVAGVLAFAGPASADTSGGTPVTFEVGGDTLDITVPTAPVDLGSVIASTSSQMVSAQLGTVTVTDGRGGTAGWTVTASAVDFTGPQNISISAAGSSTYHASPATVTGTAAVAGSDLSPLFPAGPVQAATGVVGVNTASWDPTITVRVPANALAGRYSSTITESVS